MNVSRRKIVPGQLFEKAANLGPYFFRPRFLRRNPNKTFSRDRPRSGRRWSRNLGWDSSRPRDFTVTWLFPRASLFSTWSFLFPRWVSISAWLFPLASPFSTWFLIVTWLLPHVSPFFHVVIDRLSSFRLRRKKPSRPTCPKSADCKNRSTISTIR